MLAQEPSSSHSKESLSLETAFHVHNRHFGEIEIRILGPIQLWGGEITILREDLDKFKNDLKFAAQTTGFRFSGYFMQTNEQITFHLSRLPRRVELAVASVEEYTDAFKALCEKVCDYALSYRCGNCLESCSTNKCRAIVGLNEGYYESFKTDLIAKIDDLTIKSIEELRAASDKVGLDLKRFNIRLEEFTSLESLKDVLSSTPFSKQHSPESAHTILGNKFIIRPIQIYAVSPESIYSEPGIKVEADSSQDTIESLVILANQFLQARFSLEELNARIASNIELLSFSNNCSNSTN